MIKFPLPIKAPRGTRFIVTQGFGVTTNTIEPEGPNGEPHFHYGVDLVWGTGGDMFGSEYVCPNSTCEVSAYLEPPKPPTSTPFVNLTFTGASGNKYEMTLAHVSKILLATSYAAGQTIALAGNYGMLVPQPTFDQPYDGTHLHLGLKVNGAWADPLEYFDLSQFNISAARPLINCLPRAQWALSMVEAGQ